MKPSIQLEPSDVKTLTKYHEVSGYKVTLTVELPFDMPRALREMEDECVRMALAKSGGVVSKAAELLGVGRTTMCEKLRRRPELREI